MTAASVRRHYVNVGIRQVHYRRAGAGPPAVLLHESPFSSQSLTWLAERISARFTAIAVDTPGNGGSDPLALECPEITDYADALAETLDALRIERCAVYGVRSGACIALEFGRRHPERAVAMVLEGLPVLTDDERADLLTNYFPRFPPEISGGHLLRLWTYVRDQHLFFPWYRRELRTRLDLDVPDANHLQAGVIDLLRAGDAYRAACEAAFRYVPEPALAKLAVPTAIVASENDPFAPHLGRLPPLRACCRRELLPRDRDARAARVASLLATGGGPPTPAPPPTLDIPGRIARSYVDTEFGQLLVRRRSDAPGRLLLMLHASPGSAAMLEPLLNRLSSDRPVLALDTLGNGDSDKPSFTEPWIGDYASVVADAIDRLDLGTLDLYGTHTGALIAVETAILMPNRVRSVILEGVPLFEPHQVGDLLAKYTPPLEPRWDGSHLVFAWAFLRDQTLFWPWYNRTRGGIRWVEPVDPEALHRWVVEFLKSGSTYPLAYRAAFSYPTRERLPKLRARALVCAAEDDMLGPCVEEASRLAPNAVSVTLPRSLAEQAEVFVRFLHDPTWP